VNGTDIDTLVRSEQQRAHDRYVAAAVAEAARASSKRRYVTLTRRDDGSLELLLRNPAASLFGILRVVAWLALLGGPFITIAALSDEAGLAASLAVMTASTALLLWWLTARDLRLISTGANYLVYRRFPSSPLGYGPRSSLEIGRYSWNGRNGILVRSYAPTRWEDTIMGIEHPEDLATIEAFKRGRT